VYAEFTSALTQCVLCAMPANQLGNIELKNYRTKIRNETIIIENLKRGISEEKTSFTYIKPSSGKNCFCVQICIRKKSNYFKWEKTIIASTYSYKTDHITFTCNFLFILVAIFVKKKKLLFWSNPIAVINQPRLHVGLSFCWLQRTNTDILMVCVCVWGGDKRDPKSNLLPFGVRPSPPILKGKSRVSTFWG